MRLLLFAYTRMRNYISQIACISYINTKHSSVGIEHRQSQSVCRFETMFLSIFRYGPVVRIFGLHPNGGGSIPPIGTMPS